MRFFLLENGLISYAGHHYMEASSFRYNAKKYGIETVILAHRKVLKNIRDELDAIPLFSNRPYDIVSSDPLCGDLENFIYFGKQIFSSLNSLGDRRPNCSDLLVLTLTKQSELIGLANWLQLLKKEERPSIALNFMVDNLTQNINSVGQIKFNPMVAQFYRYSIQQIFNLMPEEKVLLTAGSPKLSSLMTNILGRKVNNFPLPVCLEIESEPISEIKSNNPVVAYLGKSHPRKFPDQIIEIILEVWKTNASTHFLLQGNPESYAHHWSMALEEGIHDGRIHIVQGEIDQKTYYRLLISSDIVFLPYKEKKYLTQTSGIFAEALSVGKVTVVPENTWMSDVLQQQKCGGVTFQGLGIEACSSAIIQALDSLEVLKAQAHHHADMWKQSMGMKSYVKQLLKFHKK